MTTGLKALLVAGLVSFSMPSFSASTVVNFHSNPGNISYSDDISGTSQSDTILFELTSSTTYDFGLSILDLPFAPASGVSGAVSSVINYVSSPLSLTTIGTINSGASKILTLAAGKYYITVAGSGNGIYNFTGIVQSASPVSEPENMALLLAGLSVFGLTRKLKKA